MNIAKRWAVLGVAITVAMSGQAVGGLIIGDEIKGYNDNGFIIYGLNKARAIVDATATGFDINPPSTYSPYPVSPLETIVLTTTTISVTIDQFDGLGATGTYAHVYLTDSNPNISNVTIASNTIVGFDDSRLSFTSNSITLDITSLRGQNGHTVVLNVGDTIATPEPSTLVSASIAGLMGLGYARRRKRTAY